MKEKEEKKYYLPQRVSKTRVEVYEVSKEIYDSTNREIGAQRKRCQRNGECACPKNKLWQCDGCCIDCPFYHKQTISLNAVAHKDDKGEGDITFEEITPDTSYGNTPETVIFKSLIEELKEELSNIDPKAREIFDAIYEKVISNDFESLRSVAEEMDIPWSTFKRKLIIVREWSEKKFKNN